MLAPRALLHYYRAAALRRKVTTRITTQRTMPLTFDTQVALPGASLRPWRTADAPALQHALEASEAHLRAWTPWVIDGRVPGQSLPARLAAHARAFVDGTEWVYGLFAPDDATVLGGCGLYPRVGPGALEIGYWLAAYATGRGLATAAASALATLAFAAPGIERLEIRCDPRNVASARVPARLGFRLDERASVAADGLQVWTLARSDANAPAT